MTPMTVDELLVAIEEINATDEETDLEKFAGITVDSLGELLKRASTPLSEDEATYMFTGILVALRAVKNRENSD